MNDPTIQDSEAAAVAILNVYVLNALGDGPRVETGLFVKKLDGWTPAAGITPDDVNWYLSHFKDGDLLLGPSQKLEEQFARAVQTIKETRAANSLWGKTGQPSPNDVHQGQIGDCSFLSATTALVKQDPALFKKRILLGDPANVNGVNGNAQGVPTYKVYFGDMSVQANPQPVQVTLTYAQIAAYASAYSGGYWLSVWEQAYIKSRPRPDGEWIAVNSQAATLSLGEPLKDPLKYITGNKVEVKTLQAAATEAATKDTIVKALSDPRKPIITAETPKFSAASPAPASFPNLPGPHAFTVIGYDATTDTVKLQNPWGIQLPAGQGYDAFGTFTMKWADFYKYFLSVAIEQLPPKK